MTNRVTRTPQAQADLIALAEYDRAEAGLATALRFVESAEAALCALCEHPRMGAVLDLAAAPEAGIRRWHISGFTRLLILDRPTADGVQLIRVLDAARDLDDLFRPGSHGSASESALFFRAVGNVSARTPSLRGSAGALSTAGPDRAASAGSVIEARGRMAARPGCGQSQVTD